MKFVGNSCIQGHIYLGNELAVTHAATLRAHSNIRTGQKRQEKGQYMYNYCVTTLQTPENN